MGFTSGLGSGEQIIRAPFNFNNEFALIVASTPSPEARSKGIEDLRLALPEGLQQ